MKKVEFVAAMAEKMGTTKKDAEKMVSAFLETVEEVLVKEDKIQFLGFGSFETKTRPARDYRNPRTGEIKNMPASKVVAFKVSKALKDKVN